MVNNDQNKQSSSKSSNFLGWSLKTLVGFAIFWWVSVLANIICRGITWRLLPPILLAIGFSHFAWEAYLKRLNQEP